MSIWSDHGTKILGGVTAGSGAALAALPALQNVVLSPKSYALTQFSLSIAVAVIGVGTVKRGFTNSSGA